MWDDNTAGQIRLFERRYSFDGANYTAYTDAVTFTVTDRVSVRAIPSAGYSFVKWKEGATSADYIAVPTGTHDNVSLQPAVSKIEYTVNFNCDGSTLEAKTGTIGQTVQFSKVGYNPAELEINAASIAGTSGTQFDVPVSKIKYSLTLTVPAGMTATYSKNGGDSADYAGAVEFTVTDRVSVRAIPSDGYSFVNWKEGATSADYIAVPTETHDNVSLQPAVSKIEYTVTYVFVNAPAGVTAPAAISGKHVGDIIDVAPVTEISGYTFGGWKLNGAAVGGTFTMPASNVTLTGTWSSVPVVSSLYIIYDGNGATSGSAPSKTSVSGGNCVLAGNTGNLAKAGHTFAGWSTVINGAVVTSVTISGSDVTVYAVWKANTYFVTLVNGAGDSSLLTATYGSSVLPGYADPFRAGSVFNGYWTAQTGGIEVVGADGKLVLKAPGYTEAGKWVGMTACTLYAQWTHPTDTAVSINLNGTTYGTASFTAAGGMTELPNGFVKPMKYGYEFLGYFNAPSGGTKIVDADGNFVHGVDGYTLANGEWAFQGRVLELYAQWSAMSTPDPGPAPVGTITYHANGGSFEGDVESLEGSKYIGFDEIPVREGFRFLGWAETANASVPKYTSDMQDIPVYDVLALYTVWEPINNPATETADNTILYVIPWILLAILVAAYLMYRRWKAEGEDI